MLSLAYLNYLMSLYTYHFLPYPQYLLFFLLSVLVRDAHVKRFTRPTFLARLNLLWGVFFQDMIKINQICSLKAWCAYFQDKKLFWPIEISTCLENSSNLKNHKCLAQKWIYHCKFENFTFFKFTMVNPLLSRTFVIFEVGRIF